MSETAFHPTVSEDDDRDEKELQEAAEQQQEETPEQVEAKAQAGAENAGDDAVPGYEGPFATSAERDRMASDPVLRSALRAFVSRKLRPDAVDDVVQNTLLAAHRARKLPGGDGAARDKYVYAIATFKIADYWREKELQKELHAAVKVDYSARAEAADRVAERSFFSRLIAVPFQVAPEDMECWKRHKFQDVPWTTLAIERGQNYEGFAKRMKRLDEKIVAWGRTLASACVLLLCLGGWRVTHPRPQLGFDQPEPVALAPAVSTHVGEIDAKQWAGVLRARAFRACLDQHWSACLDGLSVARDFDPDGALDPVVQAAVVDAADGIDSKTNRHRPGYVPPYASRASRE